MCGRRAFTARATAARRHGAGSDILPRASVARRRTHTSQRSGGGFSVALLPASGPVNAAPGRGR